MWPWSKKKSVASSSAEFEKASGTSVTTSNISVEDIENAIISLRGNGFHFGLSYAQMNGYNEKRTNPDRLAEIIELTEEEPNFSDAGIKFAADYQISELTYIATNPNARIAGVDDSREERLEKEKAKRVLGEICRIGKGSLSAGFREVGFDFNNFLISTVTRLREADIKKVIDLAVEKKSVLRPLFVRALHRGRDKYGEVQYEKIADEVSDFTNNFFPKGSFKFFYITPPFRALFRLAISWAEESTSDGVIPKTGLDFEHWCASEIEKQGWSVTVSQASGDQGIDIIAIREDLTVAIQCKLYTTPIGNKAVQEAYAGMKHYCADLAVVIGTGGFTRSAQELARSTDVMLLDAEAIGDFSEQVFDYVN